jgi:hypothetical protein
MTAQDRPIEGGFSTLQRVLDAIYRFYFVIFTETQAADQYFLPLHAPAHFVF